jgi:hypothetical protein
MHKDVRAGTWVSYEFFRVAPTPDDGVCYFASPKGAPATRFCLVEIQAQRVVFENRGHDFPQRIAYWLDASGKLHARIEGNFADRQESEEWVWTKRASH